MNDPIHTEPGARLGSDHAPADPSAEEALENDTTQGRPGVRTSTGTLTWWGHSTMSCVDGGLTVLFDPVLTARVGHLRRVRGPVPPAHAAEADIVLISHLHPDHTHLPSLRLIPASAVLIAPAGSRRLLKPVTARGTRLREVEPGDVLTFGELKIRILAADHDGRRHAGSRHRGPALGFLVEGSRRWWYPGDTGPQLRLEEVADVDVALVPVGGWGPSIIPGHEQGHLDAEQAAAAVGRTQPHHVVPVHWGTWWPIGLPQRRDLIDLPPTAFAEHVARLAPTTRVHLLRQGQSVTL
jgi:L-ascorbate metabolism protein UlaG (beta-lactamase superfamily)